MDFDHENVRLVVNEDRLSSLPDELIHQILSCIDDTKFVVETCLLLSPRWKLIWKSVPRLSFSFSTWRFHSVHKFSKFVTNVLSRRNNHVEVFSVMLDYSGAASQAFVKKIAKYAFSHNVQELIVISRPKNHHEYPPCLFSSTSLKHFTFSSELLRADFTPKIPKTPWNFPALTTLHLSEITLCEDEREYLDLFSKCVNLKNLTLKRFIVEAKVFDIITPRLSSLVLIKNMRSTVINVIAPQLEDLTLIDCSINHLDAAPGLSSFVYTGYGPPKWFKGRFHSLNKVSVCLSFHRSNMYAEEDARETICMLQELQSAKFLTLNFDIVECLSAYPDLLSHLPSPFSNLICLNIDSHTRKDAYKVNVSTEARNFLLENSPSATFIMDIPEEPPTKAMIAKQAREMKRAKLIADIESCMTELQALLEQENRVLVERKKAEVKTKVALENIIPELKVRAKKKIMRSEPEQPKESAESQEVVAGLMTQLVARLTEMQDLGNQNLHGSIDILSKKKQVILLFKNLLKRQRVEMETRYARQLEEAKSLSVRIHSTYEDAYNYLKEMLDGVTECISKCNSTCEDVSSSKLPLASQQSSSSSAIAREMKRAKLIADIESYMTELQALLERENRVLVERKKAEEKTKVALENIIPELKVRVKKKIMRSEPEQPKESAESQEVVAGLMTQFVARLKEMQDLGKQNLHGSLDILSKKERVILLFKNLLKGRRVEMETRYARQLEEAESLSVRLHSTYEDAYNYLKEMLDDVTECISKCNSTCQDVSSSKLPLASQPSSSSSAIIPAPSTSSINPQP